MTENRNPQAISFFIVAMGVLLCLLFFGVISVFPQTNMGPIRTPQINSNLYVGQSGYATIQSAVTFACKTGNQSFAVVLLPGIAPSDTPTSVTGGCSGTYIADLRSMPHLFYHWTGTAYALTPAYSGIAHTPNMLMGDNNGNAIDSTIAASDIARLSATTNIFTGAIHAGAGSQISNSPICTEATGCPGTNVTYPPAGIGVSTGSAWTTSIDPTTVVTNQYVNCDSTSCLIYPGNSAVAGGNVFDLFPNGNLRTGVIWAYEGTTANNNPGGYRINMRLQSGSGLAFISAPTQGLYLNYDTGNGVFFGNGNGQTVGGIDATGAMSSLRGFISSNPYGVPDGTDLNTVTGCGNYSASSPGNAPPAVESMFGIQNICFQGGAVLLQVAYGANDWGFADPRIFFRKFLNNTWSQWFAVQGAAISFITPAGREPTAAERQSLREVMQRAPKPSAPSQATVAVQPKIVTPKTSKDKCAADAIWHDQRYLYVCIASGNIKRVPLQSF